MTGPASVPLSELTTLRLGGPADHLLTGSTEAELVEAVRSVDAAGEPLLVLAGGSNVVVADAGFPGAVVRVRTRGVDAVREGDAVRVTVAAGEPWDGIVARAVEEGWSGVECLSGIPGSAGATPIQNVGAYGQEVGETITAVRVHGRATGTVVDLEPAECAFAYRSSRFRRTDSHVVLAVTFALRASPASGPIRYAELARALGVEIGASAPLAEVRAAVLDLRRGKGMVIGEGDPDAVSAGSFFTNPILDADAFARLEGRAAARLGASGGPPPRYPEPDGRVKTSAAWLIERAGFGRGHGDGAIGLSSRHVLAIVNRGGGSTAELVAFARHLRDGVEEAFGVVLEPEPVLVGVAL